MRSSKVVVLWLFCWVSVVHAIGHFDQKISDAITIMKALNNHDGRRPSIIPKFITGLQAFPYDEVVEAVMTRFSFEVSKVDFPDSITDLRKDTLVAALKFFIDLGTQQYLERLEFEKTKIEKVLGKNRAYENEILPYFTRALTEMAQRRDPWPSLFHAASRDAVNSQEVTPTLLGSSKPVILDPFAQVNGGALFIPRSKRSESEKQYLYALERGKKIRDVLNRRIIGQPEIVDHFVSMEIKNTLFRGKRQHAEVMYLMGLKGTGKDSSAEAYVDAIHGKEGAHKDHMFRLPVMKEEKEFWSALGSGAGYVDSDKMPPLLKFLVAHSAGRYAIVESKGERQPRPVVALNPEWSRGSVSAGYSAPEEAVIYIDEFHNWSKIMKDRILKKALETGYFVVNNPGQNGVKEIQVPVTFILASNEGVGLITSRELNGARHGAPLTYEQIMEKWGVVAPDKALLKEEIQNTNGAANDSSRSESAVGISEELLNRIPDSSIFLLRPHSPENIGKIVDGKLGFLTNDFGASEVYSGMQIRWSPELKDFLRDYRFDAEEGARHVAGYVKNLIEKTIFEAVEDGQLRPESELFYLDLGVKKNENGTTALTFQVIQPDSGRVLRSFERVIKFTEGDRKRSEISDGDIDEMLNLSERLKKHIVGNEEVLRRLGRDALSAKNTGNQKVDLKNPSGAKARRYMFLGLTSTGKTETGKALARELWQDEGAAFVIDFSSIRTVEDLKYKILGTRDWRGNPIPSDFMKHFDKKNGKALFIFDESANCPLDVLKALYDILDESIVRTFSDGKPRNMSNVVIGLTGNAGKEWYDSVLKMENLSQDQKLFAVSEIYRQAIENEDFLRNTLERYYSEPFVARIDLQNVFFYAPFNFQTIRQLALLKLKKALRELKPKEGKRGWDVRFENAEDFQTFLEDVEREGFSIREQGRSIDNYVQTQFYKEIDDLLLRNHIACGAKVWIKPDRKFSKTLKDGSILQTHEFEENSDDPLQVKRQYRLAYKVIVENVAEPLSFSLKTKQREEEVVLTDTDRTLVGYHEAGHELITKILLGDKYKSNFITIIPGVAQIADEWIAYWGLASSDKIGSLVMTREALLREMAVLLAGEVAQTIVTKGARHDSGKSNDIERANLLANIGILKWGLSEKWGRVAIPSGMSYETYLEGLSSEKRTLLEQEAKKLIEESRDLARETLILNLENALIPLSIALVEKGTLSKKDLEAFYQSHKLYGESDASLLSKKLLFLSPQRMKARFSKFIGGKPARDAEFLSGIPKPKKLTKIEEVVESKKQVAWSKVKIPTDFPIDSWASCEKALAQ